MDLELYVISLGRRWIRLFLGFLVGFSFLEDVILRMCCGREEGRFISGFGDVGF